MTTSIGSGQTVATRSALRGILVLPHSGVPQAAFDPVVFAAFLLDHAFFVGLPIALAIKRYAE